MNRENHELSNILFKKFFTDRESSETIWLIININYFIFLKASVLEKKLCLLINFF